MLHLLPVVDIVAVGLVAADPFALALVDLSLDPAPTFLSELSV